jgi:hypothetical protein
VRRFPSPEGLTLGLFLTALGVLWTLSNLGVLEMLPLLRTWWPLSLVSWGVLELLAARTAREDA